ncbi:hypothetical protein SDC9_89315 [bioreactor metagenome]|uniref:Uncharacterized protein n=1 Tax=bioreactor metagenome TaxID=1076179 RepID=A0A644ZQJ4_9ZZZZ
MAEKDLIRAVVGHGLQKFPHRFIFLISQNPAVIEDGYNRVKIPNPIKIAGGLNVLSGRRKRSSRQAVGLLLKRA